MREKNIQVYLDFFSSKRFRGGPNKSKNVDYFFLYPKVWNFGVKLRGGGQNQKKKFETLLCII